MYHSQIDQDRILNETYFKNMKNGVFVDVGAHDGVCFSNTRFYEKELGWTGICIEPIPRVYERLKQNRDCVCLPYAVCNTDGVRKFADISGYPEMLSGLIDTYDPRHLNRIQSEIFEQGGGFQSIDVTTRRLQTIVDSENIKEIHYLSVDTEGSELDVLKSIDFNKTFVHIIEVENNYPDRFGPTHALLENNGFAHALTIWFDEIYINSKSPFTNNK